MECVPEKKKRGRKTKAEMAEIAKLTIKNENSDQNQTL